MIARDSTLSALKALPISAHPLMDYNNLYVLNRKVLESVVIAPPPDWKAYGPEGDLFQNPIQVVVLGVNSDEIKLGVYAHLALTLEQGPQPTEQWCQRWKDELDRQSLTVEPDTQPDPAPEDNLEPELDTDTEVADPDKAFILDLCDDMYDLQAAYQFFGMAMKPILQSEEHWGGSRKSQHGYAILLDWVLEHGDDILARLDQRLKKDLRVPQGNTEPGIVPGPPRFAFNHCSASASCH